MPSLREELLQFNPTTIEDVRKEYGLNKPGAMKHAIDILQEWIQKQEHILKKDFCREYLERIIISAKGSVERAKQRVDKICTTRTTLPEVFTKFHIKEDVSPNLTQAFSLDTKPDYKYLPHIGLDIPLLEISSYTIIIADLSSPLPHLRYGVSDASVCKLSVNVNVYMPKLTEDHYRPYILQFKRNSSAFTLWDAYRHNMILGEYLKRHDYANGVLLVFDVRDCNIVDLVSQINLVDAHNMIMVYTEVFRIRNIFIITPSKAVNIFSSFLKLIFSTKLGQRIIVLKTAEDLHDHLPKELLPEDLGGQQKSIMELYDKWTEELSSEEHLAYLREMAQACTNEALRRSDQPNAEYLGIAGSFKVLTVD